MGSSRINSLPRAVEAAVRAFVSVETEETARALIVTVRAHMDLMPMSAELRQLVASFRVGSRTEHVDPRDVVAFARTLRRRFAPGLGLGASS
jgi:hypothetical protein